MSSFEDIVKNLRVEEISYDNGKKNDYKHK
jgi:hypothetical protein